VSARGLHIAWLGPVPGDDGGVAGVAAELLHGLAKLGHRIDCFFPAAKHQLPERLAREQNLAFFWGTSSWRWDRWYSHTRITAFATGLLARALASVRLRQAIERMHSNDPYDVIYQFSNIETLAVPKRVARGVPLVIHPETHIAGELRCLLAERHLSRRCQPAYMFAAVTAIMSLRALVQRIRIRRARLLVCISAVFRDHMVRDYGFPAEHTVVIPNPVRLERFADVERQLGEPPTVLVLGRVAVRKGINDVVAVARALLERQVDVRVRVVGGPSLWSDYTKLLEDLSAKNAEYVGAIAAAQIPSELANSDVLLQASRYEPFALTVAEALAAGVPVVASTEVGAIEGVDGSVAAAVAPGDVDGLTSAIIATIGQSRSRPLQTQSKARAEAARLFAPERVCSEISLALERLIASGNSGLHR
jgi:glycosyltransferase involved in cell wall biosynthesis